MASHLLPLMLSIGRFFTKEQMKANKDFIAIANVIDDSGMMLDVKSKAFYTINGYAACKVIFTVEPKVNDCHEGEKSEN